MSRRSRARRAALQAIYQWQASGAGPDDVVAQFRESGELDRIDAVLFERLMRGVMSDHAALDEALGGVVDRPISQIDLVARAILRLATYELRSCPEVPWKVVVNEAIDLAHAFGADQSHRYVNGILDRLARSLRAPEFTR